jgi:WD40 repeat protein
MNAATLTGASYSTLATDVTDALGQAKALVSLGPIVGTARLQVAVPALGMADTVRYTVRPGAPARIAIGPRDTTVKAGATYTLRVSLADRRSNPTPTETPAYAALSGVASVSSAGQVTVGATLARGRIGVAWRTVVDTAFVTVDAPLSIVATRSGSTGTFVTLVNTHGANSTDLVGSGHRSLAPHSVPSTSSVVYYQADPEFNASVWIVAPGSAARDLVAGANGFASAAWPAWSPDGRWVYFTAVRANTVARSLWRIRPDGSGLDSLGVYQRTARFERVSISPDGSTAAIPGDGGVKLVNVATKSSQVLPGLCHVPRYSPDGRQFACLVNDELAVMNVDGSGLRIIQTVDPSGAPHRYEEVAGIDWSPDGKWLVGQALARGPQLVHVADGFVLSLPTLSASYTQAAFVR